MVHASISDAVHTLQELLESLDNAYWESATLDRKDLFYDIISSVNKELSELAKLSIQDHDMEYEPVTNEFKVARGKLSNLRKLLDECVLRSSTSAKLETVIGDVVAMAAH